MERKLTAAVLVNDVAQVRLLLKANPKLDINWAEEPSILTALHAASFSGHLEIVKNLLAHPGININAQDRNGVTAISFGCRFGCESVIQVLLKDPRVDVTLCDHEGHTPLWWASWKGKQEVIEWLIASGRDLGVNLKGDHWGQASTALEIARVRRKTDIISLLERFMTDSMQTRHEVRVKLGVLDEVAAEVFALIVFHCDDLLQLIPSLASNDSNQLARFFVIASKLPMELQMVLCHRTAGSMKQSILHKDSEAAFKSLARILILLATSMSTSTKPRSDLSCCIC